MAVRPKFWIPQRTDGFEAGRKRGGYIWFPAKRDKGREGEGRWEGEKDQRKRRIIRRAGEGSEGKEREREKERGGERQGGEGEREKSEKTG